MQLGPGPHNEPPVCFNQGWDVQVAPGPDEAIWARTEYVVNFVRSDHAVGHDRARSRSMNPAVATARSSRFEGLIWVSQR